MFAGADTAYRPMPSPYDRHPTHEVSLWNDKESMVLEYWDGCEGGHDAQLNVPARHPCCQVLTAWCMYYLHTCLAYANRTIDATSRSMVTRCAEWCSRSLVKNWRPAPVPAPILEKQPRAPSPTHKKRPQSC